jgi:hypothetical protein
MSSQRTGRTLKEYLGYLRSRSEPQKPSDPRLATTTLPGHQKPVQRKWSTKKRPSKTKAEADYELILKAEHPEAAILFEAVKLKIDDTCWYLPDFFIPEIVTFFEVKGSHIWEDSKIKFKAARVLYPWAKFEMWQIKGGSWKRLY